MLHVLNAPGDPGAFHPTRAATYKDQLPAELAGIGGLWGRQAIALAPYTYRVYGWPLVLEVSDAARLTTWLDERGHNRDAFLVMDPWDSAPREVALEPAVGGGGAYDVQPAHR